MGSYSVYVGVSGYPSIECKIICNQRPRSLTSSSSRSYSRSRSRSSSYSRSPVRSHRKAYSRSRSRSRSRSATPKRRYRRSRSQSKSPRSSVRNERSPSRSKSPPKLTQNKIFISKLTKNVTSDHLKEIFGQYGTVRNVDIPFNRKIKISRGIGYVEYEKEEDAQKAIECMNNGQIDGNVIKVEFALVKKRSPQAPRRGSFKRRVSPVKKYSRRRSVSRGRSRSRSISNSRGRRRSRSPDSRSR